MSKHATGQFQLRADDGSIEVEYHEHDSRNGCLMVDLAGIPVNARLLREAADKLDEEESTLAKNRARYADLALTDTVLTGELEGLEEDLLEEVMSKGEVIAYQDWDSGGLGAGAGRVGIYAYGGRFYVVHDAGMDWYDDLGDAFVTSGTAQRTEATVRIWVSEDAQTLLNLDEEGAKLLTPKQVEAEEEGEQLGGEQEKCPYCGSINEAGTGVECQHFVGVLFETGLIWGDGEEPSAVFFSIQSEVHELYTAGVNASGIVTAVSPILTRGSLALDDLLALSIDQLLGLFTECCRGDSISLLGLFESERTSLYCKDPTAPGRALKCLRSCEGNLAKLRPKDA